MSKLYIQGQRVVNFLSLLVQGVLPNKDPSIPAAKTDEFSQSDQTPEVSKAPSQINNEVTKILQKEGEIVFKPDMSKEEGDRIYYKRAIYNTHRNKDIFNELLPYRKSIIQDKKKLKQYDDLVDKILKNAKIIFTEDWIDLSQEKITVSLKDIMNQQGADPSTQYMFACSIVELFHNRPDLVDKVLARNNGLHIVIFKDPSRQPFSGMYSMKENSIWLSNKAIWENWADRSPYNDTNVAVHEFIHAVDGEENERNDGIFSEMTNAQKEDFKEARREVFDRTKKKSNLAEGQTTKSISSYALYNGDPDFLAVTAGEVFSNAPQLLQEFGPKLYEVYKDFFQFDPLTELKK